MKQKTIKKNRLSSPLKFSYPLILFAMYSLTFARAEEGKTLNQSEKLMQEYLVNLAAGKLVLKEGGYQSSYDASGSLDPLPPSLDCESKVSYSGPEDVPWPNGGAGAILTNLVQKKETVCRLPSGKVLVTEDLESRFHFYRSAAKLEFIHVERMTERWDGTRSGPLQKLFSGLNETSKGKLLKIDTVEGLCSKKFDWRREQEQYASCVRERRPKASGYAGTHFSSEIFEVK